MRKLIPLLGLAMVSCSQTEEGIEKVCGPCPDVAAGELAATGNVQIDGFFKALNYFQSGSARINAEFQAHLDALAKAFGVDCAGMDTGACATAVKTAIAGEISANVQGSLRVDYVPPKCSANVNVMVEAQAECTAQADADCTPPAVEPGSVQISCEGQCTGGCSGMCSGQCAVDVTGGSCTGSCEGGCDLTAGGTCSGTCHGACAAPDDCTAKDAQGQCNGKCSGTCTGSCEMAVAASCSGMCTGKCVAPMATASCTGECRGSCDANCTGSCEGSATPPTITPPNCDADVEAQCNASAKAQASASLDCTPPRLDIDFDLVAEGAAQVAFLAKMTVLKTEFIGIMKGLANAKILVEGDDTLGVPSIEGVLTAQLQGTASGSFDNLAGGITPYGAVCAAASLQDAVNAITDSATGLTATLNASVELSGAVFTGGV
jgi:hypothetical protein